MQFILFLYSILHQYRMLPFVTCKLSDLAGWCSATWYGDAMVVSSSSLVREPLGSSSQMPRWSYRLPQRTGRDHHGVPVSRGWTPSGVIWEPSTSHWTSSRPGSELSSVEAGVYVWRFALLVVRARKEEVVTFISAEYIVRVHML